MRLEEIIETIKQRPDAHRIGMILAHTGIVRGTTKEGRPVRELTVSVDHDKLAEIIERERRAPGIVDIQVEVVEGRTLRVGEEIMRLVVAGDVRENVIGALERALNEIKSAATSKSQIFEPEP
ncbi:MAG: molybdenum cofactor biosynthesis protein MoaE [Myxococcota bacterium]